MVSGLATVRVMVVVKLGAWRFKEYATAGIVREGLI